MATQDYYFGDLLPRLYQDCRIGKITEDYLPRADLAYITSLLNHRFGRKYSFRQVAKLLKEEGIK